MKKGLLSVFLILGMAGSCTKAEVKPDLPAHWGKIIYLGSADAYGIIMDDGTRLLPVNLDIKFQADSLVVLFDYVENGGDQPGQWGRSITIQRMQME